MTLRFIYLFDLSPKRNLPTKMILQEVRGIKLAKTLCPQRHFSPLSDMVKTKFSPSPPLVLPSRRKTP